MTARHAYLALAVVLGALAAAKALASGAPGGADPGILSLFSTPWVWVAIVVAELAVAATLLATRSRLLVCIVAIALAGAVILHGIDVAQRGAGASGCACFGSPGASTAGFDLVRTSLLFALFALGAAWPPGRPSRKNAIAFTAVGLALGASFFLPPPPTPPEPDVPTFEPLVTSEVEEKESPPPVLRAAGEEVVSSRPPRATPPPPAGPRDQSLVKLRVVTQGGNAVDGASVVAVRLLEDIQGDAVATGATDEDGRCSLQCPKAAFPLAFLIRARSPLIPQAVESSAPPTDELLVRLHSGMPLEIKTLDLDGSPLAGVPVVVSAAGVLARGEPNMVRRGSNWALADSRRATTDASGRAVLQGLDADTYFGAHASGFATPMSPAPAAVKPGPGRVLELRIAPLRYVWARAIDALTGKPIPTAAWRRVLPKPTAKPAVVPLFPARLESFSTGLPDHVLSWMSGDYLQSFVTTGGADGSIEFGPLVAAAPGYESKEVMLEARSPPAARNGPIEIRLSPVAALQLTRLKLRVRTTRRDVRARLELRQGKKVVFWKFWRAGADGTIELSVVPGDYVLEVSGNILDPLRVDGGTPAVRTVDLDALPSVQIRFSVASKPYTGPAGLIMRTDTGGRGEWHAGFMNIPFAEGKSPAFVVPPKRMMLAASCPDGTSATGRIVVRDAEHLQVAMEAD